MEVHLVELREAAALLKMESKCALLIGVEALSLFPLIPLSPSISVTLKRKMIRHGAEISSCPQEH